MIDPNCQTLMLDSDQTRTKGKNMQCESCGQIGYLVDGVVCEPCDIEMWGE